MTCHCGKPFIRHGGTFSTLVGYGLNAEGHHHDDNCEKRTYVCEDGHRTILSRRQTCATPGCDWRGKEACGCHPSPKIDAWPEGIPEPTRDEVLAFFRKDV